MFGISKAHIVTGLVALVAVGLVAFAQRKFGEAPIVGTYLPK